jgi:aspartyl-tRNA(Asn)/glutamyl-tRNA(Gln) amidotransferase subunit A
MLIAKHGARMSSHMVDLMTRPWTAEDLTNANIGRKAIANRRWRFKDRYDLVLTPTLCVPPFPILMQGPDKVDGCYVQPAARIGTTFALNLTGQPAATVPAGFTTVCRWACKS